MAEKNHKIVSNHGSKPTPMKLFASWENEKTSPICVARHSTLKLSYLNVVKPFAPDLGPILIAVKMQSAKRTLRSSEIALQPSGLINTELDLTFSLQYSHCLKGDSNRLQILLQRRKRYKNRTILGYKTLALGLINMALVLQRPYEQELRLYSDPKECQVLVAVIRVDNLVTYPADQDETALGKMSELPERFESEEDEEFSSNDDGSDSEPHFDGRDKRQAKHIGAATIRQQNLKQKFMTLLRRFRVSEGLHELESEKIGGAAGEIDDLLEDLDEYVMDSEQEVDTVSVVSTPKPSLRPFFSSSSQNVSLGSTQSPSK